MKKLICFILSYLILANNSTNLKAADVDEVNKVTRQKSSVIGITEEGICNGILYVCPDRLHQMFSVEPETSEGSAPEWNRYKYANFKNEKGVEETCIFLTSLTPKDMDRLGENGKFVEWKVIAFLQNIEGIKSALGVTFEMPPKEESSKKEREQRKKKSKFIPNFLQIPLTHQKVSKKK